MKERYGNGGGGKPIGEEGRMRGEVGERRKGVEIG